MTTKRMLIDATHEEETRVAIIEDNRLVDFDYESQFRKPLKGSIFLAKVTRVEPSLQAAFVNFGGNRHGFLPFSEIHPDYFRIPIADREVLMAEQEDAIAEAEAAEEAEEEELRAAEDKAAGKGKAKKNDKAEAKSDDDAEVSDDDGVAVINATADLEGILDEPEDDPDEEDVDGEDESADDGDGNKKEAGDDAGEENKDGGRGRGGRNQKGGGRGRRGGGNSGGRNNRSRGAQRYDDNPERRFRYNLRRKYKIQEVIKRGQIMLVQASKEERGNKGAAVGSYLSLPGRYCVLMPNSPRAGGVSRKIANFKDRKRMREIMKELEVPKGMSVILRTAGLERTKAEIKRDLDYLIKLWNNIRELTLESSAPALVYQEADLIKRSVRDLYTRDVEDIIVSGEAGFKNAKNFMKMMIPSHAKNVKEFKDEGIPLFNKYKVETQIAEIGETQVTLPSGGYLVINPTEALVSVDVNSGKSTKERHIEETALRTNLEAAVEVARQLRLRDLGGLVVIDFIDMEDRRNNGKVERKMRDALSDDRARVQVGRISSFGLMELSRQRLSPSLTESQFEVCTHCAGTGSTRTEDAATIMVLRAIEDEGIKGRAAQVIVHVSSNVAVYILNNKRSNITALEARYGFQIMIRADESVGASGFRVEVSRPSDKSGDGDSAGGEKPSSSRDDDGEESSGSRRRGRRGGRRRGGRGGEGRNDRNDRSDQDASESKPVESTDGAEAVQKEEKAAEKSKKKATEEKPKSASRGRGRKKADVTQEEDKATEVKNVSSEEKEEEGEAKAEKPKKAAARKRAPAKAKAADMVKDESESRAKAENPKKASKTKAKSIAKKDAVSNDETGKDEAPKDYETVNQEPESKKKGWWSR